MQGLIVIAALLLTGYGFSAGGWQGALTGFIAAVGVGSGLAIMRAAPSTGVAGATSRGHTQRAGGLVATIGVALGALYGGWDTGWLWAVPGYALGILFAAIAGAFSRKLPESGAPSRSSRTPVEEAALRILYRGSRNPAEYESDARRVLAFACSRLSMLAAGPLGIQGAAKTVGEAPETIRALLQEGGYDLERLASGESSARIMYAMEATNERFADVRQPGD